MARILGPDFLALQVRDLEASRTFEAHGVPIVQQPFDGPFGRTFSFVDPDGYTITVHGAP